MASKSGQQEPEKAEVIEEMLDALDTALDRVKVLYEQYFLGIQKQPPAYLHTDIERKIRDLAQIQIRNTAMRYRFATLQQKFGSYNSYWRRTVRQIENGTYARNLHKVGRQAAKTGASVPEEILAAMPKRMRDQVVRDREAVLALARLRERPAQHDDELLTLADEDVEVDVGDLATDDLDPAAFIRESSDVRRNALTAAGAHRVDETDAEFDVDAFFASVIQDDAPSRDTLARPAAPTGDPERPRRSGRPSSRPPAVARTATGHPRPAAHAGSPGVAAPPGRPVEPGAPRRRPSTRRPPPDEGPPSFAESAGLVARKVTGPIRTARPPSSPGGEPAPPRSPTGRMPIARPAPVSDTEPQLSAPTHGSASPAAATRKITGPMRTVRPPSNPDLEPESEPPGEPADRLTGPGAAAPASSGDTGRRLSIPPIRSTTPAAATRRITPLSRAAVKPPPDADPDSGSSPIPAPTHDDAAPALAAPSGTATGPSRAVAAARTGSAGGPTTVRLTGPAPAAAAPASEDAGPTGAAVQGTGTRRAVAAASEDAAPASAGGRAAGPSRIAAAAASEDAGSAGAVRGTGTNRAVAAPASAAVRATGPSRAVSALASEAGAPASVAIRGTGTSRAVATPASGDDGYSAGPASAAGEPAARDPGAFAAESTQRSRPAGIPVLPPVPAPGAGGKSIAPPGVRAPGSPSSPTADPARAAPSQATKPLRVAPGSAAAHAATPVETLAGPFPRIPSPPSPRAAVPAEPPAVAPPPPPRADRSPPPSSPAPAAAPPAAAPPAAAAPPPAPPVARRPPPPVRDAPPPPPKRADAAGARPPSEPRQAPPPGMTDADVNALYAKYVKAKQILGEEAEPGTYGKLLKTIHAQAPKIMEQYKARGVDFSVVVKDNQVIIRAKPKT